MGVASVGVNSPVYGAFGVEGEFRFMRIFAPQHSEYFMCVIIDRIRLPADAIIAVITRGSDIYNKK